MKYLLRVPALLFLSFFIFAGCATTAKNEKIINIQQSISTLQSEKTELKKRLEHPATIDEPIEIKKRIEEIDAEINKLELARDKGKTTDEINELPDKDGFKNTTQRKIYYGPLGVVLQFTEWILEKLYIIHTS